MVNAISKRGALSAAEFETSAVQADSVRLPGCSGNVVPGAPGSAERWVSAATATLVTIAVILLMSFLWVGLGSVVAG
jgi:hypothetical protein